MSDMSIQAAWNEPVQAGQHFKNVLAPWCKSMWAIKKMDEVDALAVTIQRLLA